MLKTIQRFGPYKAAVLIHGESGIGKELVARALHTMGSVPEGPFVTFNCSNLVDRWRSRNSSAICAAPSPMRARIAWLLSLG